MVGAFLIARRGFSNSIATRGNILSEQSNDFKPNSVVIGYCPTMQIYLEEFGDDQVRFESFSTSSESLQKLREGKVDAVLIGRRARQEELVQGISMKQLKEGFTLVGTEPGMIDYDLLTEFVVYTNYDEQEVEGLLPADTQLVFVDSLEEALTQLTSQRHLALISWSDYSDELELVIPMRGDAKVEEFRAPHLYYKADFEDKIGFIN